MSKILDLLADIPTNAVLRERHALIREQAQILEKQLAEVRAENATLRGRVAALENALAEVEAAQTTKSERASRGVL